ncbi:MAG TPA: hypothetical protein VJZ71_03985 [Phycisphaerae bacterium]|nr:hypothetical protein [Phycisphaerae bacterium]
MRQLLFGIVLIIVGCGVLPALSPPPAHMTPVVGGISNTRPFLGNFKIAGADASSGTFLLASCGCGDWRALFKPDDGSPQTQMVVLFYSNGAYTPTGEITVYGHDEATGRIVSGSADQDTGLFIGKSQTTVTLEDIAAQRGDAHDLSVVACGMCHIGDDAIYPLPPYHPDKYKTNPLVCLECHSVDGQ